MTNFWLRGSSSIVLALLTSACSSTDPVLPDVSQATFLPGTGITNPYLLFPSGATWTLNGTSAEGLERIEVAVPGTTKMIQGVEATVVTDKAYLNDVLIEDTTDWYAQDTDGNVWYLGEDTCTVENNVCVDNEGSWEWGVDGALPGLAMPADPTVNGQPYFQEFYAGHAEDVGEVIAIGEAAENPTGSYDDCVKTHDTSTLITLDETKLYCRDVGLVLIEEPGFSEVLVAKTGI